MLIQLAEAAQSDRGRLRQMLDRYLHELSAYRDVPVGATDSANYPLDCYWSERGRHAFLILSGGRPVGFVFVRDPASTGSATNQLAEFFIEPEYRRLHIGREAVAAVWQLFPGNWELQVHARNAVAQRFWSSCVEAVAGTVPPLQQIQAIDGIRFQFNFRVEHGRRA